MCIVYNYRKIQGKHLGMRLANGTGMAHSTLIVLQLVPLAVATILFIATLHLGRS